MASYSSAANDVNFVQQNYRAFLLRVQEIREDVNNGAGVQQIGGTVARLLSSIAAQRSQIATIQDVIIPSIDDASQTQIEALYDLAGEIRDNLNNLTTELRNLLSQARQNDNNRELIETQPKDSAGAIVKEEQDAREDGATTQNPPAVVPPVATEATTAPVQDNTNLGADGATSTVGGSTPVIKQSQTQSGAVSNTDDAYEIPPTKPGTATTQGQPAIAPEFLETIQASDNKLAGLSNMSYTVSIYLMNPAEYQQLIVSQDKVLPGKQLIIQTGGAPVGERNQWFDVDFYIEELYIQSIVGTQAVGAPHNAVDMSFKVLEPQGITFLNRLNNAAIEHSGLTGNKASELNQNYLMVIRFYGYDEAGNRVTGAQLGFSETATDSDAIVEKFIPFQIADINYRITTKAVEYSVKCTIPQTNIGFSQARATIPFNLNLVAPDVQTLLNGNFVLASQQDEDEEIETENATPQGLKGATITQGLCKALNQHQKLLVDGGAYDVADEYEIVLEDADGLKDAKMAKPGRVDKKQTPTNNSKTAASRFLGSKVNFDKENRVYSITAGTQIVQLIDLVMRSSSYITDQQNVVFDEKTGEIKGSNPKVPTVQWYRVRCQTVPIKYDNKRRAYAYKIKYVVSRYQINTPRNPYYPPAAYRGVHKLYNYWFTGLNTEVLDFEIDVNANYLTIIGNDGKVDETPTGRYPNQVIYGAPNESQQGGTKGSSFPAANLSDRLYNIADVANAKLTIVGDPDWIQQSEVLYNEKIDLKPFMPDGSVNFDASEVLYEIRFNPVADYDLQTGLTPVYENKKEVRIEDKNVTIIQSNVAQERIIWAAAIVHNYFKDGKFTQELVGTIREFDGAINQPIDTTQPPKQEVEREPTTPKPVKPNSNKNTPVPVPADINNVATETNLDVAGGTASSDEPDKGFFDVDDDLGIPFGA